MRTQSPFTRDRSPFAERRRSISPKNYSTTINRSQSTIKSEHLWQSL